MGWLHQKFSGDHASPLSDAIIEKHFIHNRIHRGVGRAFPMEPAEALHFKFESAWVKMLRMVKMGCLLNGSCRVK